MPDSFHCKSCHLCFALGWYHFHGYHVHASVPYRYATLCTCLNCGVVHRILHGSRKTMVGGEEKEELLTAIVVQPEPITWIPGPPDEDGEIDLHFIGKEWQAYPYPIDPNLEFRPFRGSNEFKEALKHLTCPYCHETGKLVASHSDISTCPRCGNTEFDTQGWMT